MCHRKYCYYDDHARRVLQQVVDTTGPTSRVVLCEYIIPEDDNPEMTFSRI